MRIGALVSLVLLALPSPLTRTDLERAVALARFPHTDAERTKFHDRYLTVVSRASGPVSWRSTTSC